MPWDPSSIQKPSQGAAELPSTTIPVCKSVGGLSELTAAPSESPALSELTASPTAANDRWSAAHSQISELAGSEPTGRMSSMYGPEGIGMSPQVGHKSLSPTHPGSFNAGSGGGYPGSQRYQAYRPQG